MKKIIIYTAAALSIAVSISFSAFAVNADTTENYRKKLPPKVTNKIVDHIPGNAAASDTSYSWYCRHLKNGDIPPCPQEMSFIKDLGGVYLGNPEEKVIYLTFDVGYENGTTSKILDTMKEKDVKGAFFVLENIALKNANLLRRMYNEGHLICNHTANHKDMSKITDENAFKEELDLMNTLCKEAGVECAPFYRPPEGKFSRANLDFAKNLGYTTVFWSFAYADWDNTSQPPVDSAKAKILDGTHNGMILLLHPTSSTNAEILGDLIDQWRSDGYRFGSLTELSQQ